MIELNLKFHWLAYSKLEEAYLAQNKYDKIKSIYEKVLSKHPDNIRTRLALAQYYQKLGELENAKDEIKEALKILPDSQCLREYLMELIIYNIGGEALKECREIFGACNPKEIPYHCEKCGYQSLGAPWKCPQCRQWNTFCDPLQK